MAMRPSFELITKKPRCEIVLLTKELVDALLALNTKNRRFRPSVARNYERLLDRWLVTNQGIGVSASGHLTDGQHRLVAIKEAGYPEVEMLIVTGLSDEAAAAVDVGSNRNAGDYLHFLFNEKVSLLTTAILRTLMLAERKWSPAKFMPQEYADAFENFAPNISAVMDVANTYRLPAAVLASLVHGHWKGHEELIVDFTRAVSSGEMLEKNHPALVLRNWIVHTKGHSGQNTTVDRFEKTNAAFLAFCESRSISKLYPRKSQQIAKIVDRRPRGSEANASGL
jgi:hypothetical protein